MELTKTIKWISIVFLLFFINTVSAAGATGYVSTYTQYPEGVFFFPAGCINSPHTTLQSAIDSENSYTEIIICDESLNPSVITLNYKSDLTIKGLSNTVLTFSNQGTAFTLNNASNLIFENLELRGPISQAFTISNSINVTLKNIKLNNLTDQQNLTYLRFFNIDGSNTIILDNINVNTFAKPKDIYSIYLNNSENVTLKNINIEKISNRVNGTQDGKIVGIYSNNSDFSIDTQLKIFDISSSNISGIEAIDSTLNFNNAYAQIYNLFTWISSSYGIILRDSTLTSNNSTQLILALIGKDTTTAQDSVAFGLYLDNVIVDFPGTININNTVGGVATIPLSIENSDDVTFAGKITLYNNKTSSPVSRGIDIDNSTVSFSEILNNEETITNNNLSLIYTENSTVDILKFTTNSSDSLPVCIYGNNFSRLNIENANFSNCTTALKLRKSDADLKNTTNIVSSNMEVIEDSKASFYKTINPKFKLSSNALNLDKIFIYNDADDEFFIENINNQSQATFSVPYMVVISNNDGPTLTQNKSVYQVVALKDRINEKPIEIVLDGAGFSGDVVFTNINNELGKMRVVLLDNSEVEFDHYYYSIANCSAGNSEVLYQCYEIKEPIESLSLNAKKYYLEMAVLKEWRNASNLVDFKILHKENGVWKALNFAEKSQTPTHFWYSVEIPGFSEFKIAGYTAVVNTPQTPPANNPPTQNPTTPPVTTPPTQSPTTPPTTPPTQDPVTPPTTPPVDSNDDSSTRNIEEDYYNSIEYQERVNRASRNNCNNLTCPKNTTLDLDNCVCIQKNYSGWILIIIIIGMTITGLILFLKRFKINIKEVKTKKNIKK